MNLALLVASILVIALGFWGLAGSRDLIRLLICMELITVGVFLGIAGILTLNPVFLTFLVILMIAICCAETVLFVALIYRNYRIARTTDTKELPGGE